MKWLKKRTDRNSIIQSIGFHIFALAAALFVGGVILLALGFDIVSAYGNLFGGAFGNKQAFGETLNKAIPIALTGLSYAIAKDCGLANLGGEGQLYIGGLISLLIGTNFAGLPPAIHVLTALLGGFLGGALWGCIVAALKVKFDASELIVSIMLNHIAMQLVSYLVTGPIRQWDAPGNFPQSFLVFDSAELPRIWQGTRLHAGLFVAIAALVFFYVFLNHTTKGYELRVTGLNKTASDYAGINTSRITFLTMFLAGGFAGLGGAVEILGLQHRLIEGFSMNFGFDGVAVALLGNTSAPGIAVASVLMATLRSGSNKMEMISGVPNGIIYTIQGLVILSLVSREMFNIKRSGAPKMRILRAKRGNGE